LRRDRAVNRFAVLRFLALNPGSTCYEVARGTGLSPSTVHKIVEGVGGLRGLRFVKVVGEKPFKGGLVRRTYALTFMGLVQFFAGWPPSTVSEVRNRIDELRECISKYSGIYDYPIFAEWDFIESKLSEYAYGCLRIAAELSLQSPPRPYALPMIHAPYFVGESSDPWDVEVLRFEVYWSPSEEDKEWMDHFALNFIISLVEWGFPASGVKRMPNSKLYAFFEEVSLRHSKRMRDEWKIIENLMNRGMKAFKAEALL